MDDINKLDDINQLYDEWCDELTIREHNLKLLVKYDDTDIDDILNLIKSL